MEEAAIEPLIFTPSLLQVDVKFFFIFSLLLLLLVKSEDVDDVGF